MTLSDYILWGSYSALSRYMGEGKAEVREKECEREGEQ